MNTTRVEIMMERMKMRMRMRMKKIQKYLDSPRSQILQSPTMTLYLVHPRVAFIRFKEMKNMGLSLLD
jgi:hypothetical protein